MQYYIHRIEISKSIGTLTRINKTLQKLLAAKLTHSLIHSFTRPLTHSSHSLPSLVETKARPTAEGSLYAELHAVLRFDVALRDLDRQAQSAAHEIKHICVNALKRRMHNGPFITGYGIPVFSSHDRNQEP